MDDLVLAIPAANEPGDFSGAIVAARADGSLCGLDPGTYRVAIMRHYQWPVFVGAVTADTTSATADTLLATADRG